MPAGVWRRRSVPDRSVLARLRTVLRVLSRRYRSRRRRQPPDRLDSARRRAARSNPTASTINGRTVKGSLMTTTHYDAVVIGSGQAGGPLSTALARAGHRTALIEREHIGGTCINEGCTPTKTMVASARVAYLARRGADYGVHTGPIEIDMVRVRQRKRDIVDSFRNGSQRSIESTEGVDLLMGEAHFTGPKELEVRLTNGETRQLTANTFFINVGARPSKPSISRVDSVPT